MAEQKKNQEAATEAPVAVDTINFGALLETLAEAAKDFYQDTDVEIRISFVPLSNVFRVTLHENGTAVESAMDENSALALFTIARAWVKRVNPYNAIRRLFEILEASNVGQVRQGVDREGATG
jgi:hypothetical protein